MYNNETFPCVYTDNSGEDEHINSKEECFHYIISNLPMGYELWMRVSINYSQIKTMWNQRCKYRHKLRDWEEFGEFIKTLPMANELIINENTDNS